MEKHEEKKINNIESNINPISQVYDVKNIFSPQIQTFEPFGGHVDPSRSNMSSKQILQVVTSRMNDSPFILNKAFKDFTDIKSPYCFKAPLDGKILNSDFNILFILYYDKDANGNVKDRMAFEYIPVTKKIQAHALHLRYVKENGEFKAGDILFDYTGQTKNGIPKIGYRTKVLFGSFLGYTAEDAMVISESYSKRAQVDYYEKLYIPITKKFKYIPNENGDYFYKKGQCQKEAFAKYIKIDPSMNYDSQLADATEENSRYYVKRIDGLDGALVTDFKFHKINRDPFTTATKQYVYSPKIIEEISNIYNEKFQDFQRLKEIYKDLITPDINVNDLAAQLLVSYLSNSKLPARLLNEVAEEYGILDKDIDYLLEVDICQTVPTVLGDKFANCFAGKGVISMILPDHLMPGGVDLIFNPLGIYGRNNWGSIFELGLTKVIKDIEANINDKELTKEKISLLNELFIKRTDYEYYLQVCDLLNVWDENYSLFVDDVIENGLYINADTFPNFPYYDFYHSFVKVYGNKYNLILEKQPYILTKELQQYIIDTRGYTLNGLEEIEDVETEAFIGDSYYLKLFHTSYSKYNAVSIAKSFNRANGQPAKGRKKNGGQHTSWMTTAAALGHSDDSYIMKELRTIKSDCQNNKEQFFLDKTYTGKYIMKDNGYDSKTNEMLNHYLAAMFGMKLVHTGEAVETSRATEYERILNKKTEENLVIKASDFSKNVDIIFNDFELNDLDFTNVIDDKRKDDYFDEVESHIKN